MTRLGIILTAVALLATAFLAFGCSTGRAGSFNSHNWPSDCVSGDSGPTLNPGDAYRQARENALFALAEARLGVHVVSEFRETADGTTQQHTQQTIQGLVQDTRIVSVQRFQEDVPGITNGTIVRAIACPSNFEGSSHSSRKIPAWLYDPPNTAGNVCTLGLSGPTLDPSDQEEKALQDARLSLSQSLEMTVIERQIDNGRTTISVQRNHTVSSATETYVEQHAEIVERWDDPRGEGPLGWPNMLYVLACVPLP